MRTQDFDYSLPEELIAQQPLPERSASRMLFLGPDGHADLGVRDLPERLQPEDLLVFNNTRVIPARLHGVKRDSGGRV
jgi:S-adenosylmethionine:tRNA ribosyltransferase-isomerase